MRRIDVRALLAIVQLLGVGAVWSCSSSEEKREGVRAVGCSLNSECNSPLKCIFQRCHGACAETDDCETGERCVRLPEGNVCQLPSEMQCTYTSECPAPLKCAVDSKCRAACVGQSDCLNNQLCVTGVCADPDQIDLNTGSLPVTNSHGFQGAGGGANGGGGTANGGGGGANSADGGASGAGGSDSMSETENGGTTSVGNAGAAGQGDSSAGTGGGEAPSTCAPGAGVVGNFQPSNLPLSFVAQSAVKPLLIANNNCSFDTDTLTGTGCGSAFATDTASSSVTLSDGRTAAVLTVASFTLNAGITFTFGGQRPLIIVANGRIEINGTIRGRASAANGAWGGGAPAVPTGDHVGFTPLTGGNGGGGKGDSTVTGLGAGGGAFCGPGGHGSDVGGSVAPGSGGLPYGEASLIPLVGGSSGGSAVGGFATSANHGGGALQIVSGDTIQIGQLGIIDMGGGFPDSPGKSVSGGGGGSGGAILLEAPFVSVLGVLAANGGGGGGGYLEHGDPASASSTPAAGGGLGGVGAAGLSVAGGDAKPYTGTQYAGGGGGGAGRIRINVGCGGTLTVDSAAVISPAQGTSCFSTGTIE